MKLLTILLALFSFAAGLNAATSSVLNAVLVRVNDEVITLKDVQMRMIPDLEFLAQQYGSRRELLAQKIKELEAKHLEQLVEEKLILHEFKTAGYNFPETYLEDKVDEDIRGFGDRVTLTKTLQAQGMTFETYKEKVRERLIIRLMLQHHLPGDPVISPFKIERYYNENREQFQLGEQVKLRMIVITNQPPDAFISSKRLAQEIATKLDGGADFAEMARVYSQGSQSVEGGDWGWLERSVLRADLAEKAFALEPGSRSNVIEAPDGCYIILVEEKRAAHIKPLSDVREEIEATLKAKENDRLRKKWIDRLKAKSFVRYY